MSRFESLPLPVLVLVLSMGACAEKCPGSSLFTSKSTEPSVADAAGVGGEASPGSAAAAANAPAEGEADGAAGKGEAEAAGSAEGKAGGEAAEAAGTAEGGDTPATAPGTGAEGSGPSFHPALVAEHPRLHPMADGGLLVSVGPQIYVVGDGTPLVEEPSLRAGLPPPLTLEADWLWDLDLVGRWPDEVFASYWIPTPPNSIAVPRPSFRRRDGTFSPLTLGGGDHTFYYVDGRPYVDGSILALRRFELVIPAGLTLQDCTDWDSGKQARCDKRIEAVKRQARTSKQLVVIRGLAKGPTPSKTLGKSLPILEQFDSLASGHVFASTEDDRARMLVITPTEARFDVLPGPTEGRLRIRAVRALAEDRVFASGGRIHDGETTPALFRYDGRAWIEEPVPPCALDTELWFFEQLDAGDRFALCLHEPEEDGGIPYDLLPVWWQAPGKEWVVLDRTANAMARHGQTIWVVDHEGAYTTAPLSAAITATSRRQLDQALADHGPPNLRIDETW